MKSSTRFLVLCAAGLAGAITLVAWYRGTPEEPPIPPKSTAVGPAAHGRPTAPDPEAGIRATINSLRRLPPAEYTRGLLRTLDALGRSDPDRALTLAREFVFTREQRAIYNSLFAQLAATDPVAAVSRLALVPAGESRERALRALADGWAARDLPAALAWAQQLAAADRPPVMEAVLMTMAVDDPARAMAIARQTLAGAALDRTLTAALQSLTRANPAEAAAIVSTLPAGEVQTRAALDVARELAAQDPTTALAWAGTLPAGNVRDLALSNILEIWAASHPQDAANYAASLPAGSLQDAAAVRVAGQWAAVDPARAIAWAQTLAGEAARNVALAHIASTWAQRDPAAATHWAAATPVLPAEAFTGALSYWMQQDAGAVKTFVHALAGESQVRAATFIAPTLAQADPPAAIAWTQTLSDPAARDSALAAAYARWRVNAPGAAHAWLATANLPAAIKARLLTGP
ncbi:MAG: hypothetical protein PSU94_17685 [Lacunisphaera sp.]|nr:hypothetical protein [Lacunisphaera sp.]